MRQSSPGRHASSVAWGSSTHGEANELIGEVARSEVNEMGDAMATASGGGEASELIGETAVEDDEPKRRRGGRSKKSGGARRITKRGTTDSQDDG